MKNSNYILTKTNNIEGDETVAIITKKPLNTLKERVTKAINDFENFFHIQIVDQDFDQINSDTLFDVQIQGDTIQFCLSEIETY